VKLLILNGPANPRVALSYRGTHRANPTHCDELPEDHEVNKLFYWFLEEGGQLGVVGDLQKALRFADLWNLLVSELARFEVIEVTDGDMPPESKGVFMGYDLSARYNNSLLWWQLQPGEGIRSLPPAVRDGCDLLYRQYAPQLNGQGLFQTSDVASGCLKAMIALQDICPNLFEGGDIRVFQVVGLYRVS
jgi:hypothetical protein